MKLDAPTSLSALETRIRRSRRPRVCDACGKGPREGRTVDLQLVPETTPPFLLGHRWLCTLCAARRARRGGSR